MHLNRTDSPDNDVIGEGMTAVPASTATAGKAVTPVGIDFNPAHAEVWTHQGSPQAKSNCDTKLIVSQA